MTVMTNRGQEIIFCPRDLYDIIAEGCGREVADYAVAKVEGADAEMYEAELRINSDITAMEGEIDGWHSLAHEASNNLEQIMSYLDNKERLNRDKVYLMVQEVHEKLQKAL